MSEVSDNLIAAAEKAAGSQVELVGNTPVVETFRGQTVWEGIVSEFESQWGLYVYAWAVEGDAEPQYVTVLKKPPVDSPLAAVRVWLVNQARKGMQNR
jgi:hypothetical protein